MNIVPFGNITLEVEPETGLSRRDQFAQAAMIGLLARCVDTPQKVAEGAYRLADAMIKARE